MFKHYLTTALRHFRRHKVTTSINVACLSLGLMCFMLAWGFTAYLGQQDTHHANSPRIYLITNQLSDPKVAMPTTPWLLAKNLRTDFPQLEQVARALPSAQVPMMIDGVSKAVSIAYADPELLRVFDFPFSYGDRSHALDRPHSAVVSEALARRLFGTTNVLGRTLRYAGREDTVTITGVVGPMRMPSHISTGDPTSIGLYVEALVSMDVAEAILRSSNPSEAERRLDRWVSNFFLTYVVLPKDGSLSARSLNEQLEPFKLRHIATAQERDRRFIAQPISDFMFIALDAFTGAGRTGISSTLLITSLGGLVLLVACLNYANLASAQALVRSKEVALQKVVGANPKQIVAQYLIESLLMTGVSLVLSLTLLALLTLRSGSDTFLAFVSMPSLWTIIVAVLAVVTITAGSYPALVLSRVAPARALRNGRTQTGSHFVSTLLTALQFGSAGFLLIAVFVSASQNKALKQAVWDNASDPLVVLNTENIGAKFPSRLLKTELGKIANVTDVTGIQRLPWSVGGAVDNLSASVDPGATQVAANQFIVDKDFFKTLGIPLLAGRAFAEDRSSDVADIAEWVRANTATATEFNVIISEGLVRHLGFASANEAIDKVIYHPTGDASSQRVRIIGVVADSSLRPMTLGVTVGLYLFNPEQATVPIMRLSKSNMAATLAAIDDVWHRLLPEFPISRRFADEQFEQAYSFLGAISAAFTLLAAFTTVIAVMGLIGMALHIIRRRTHEIGVRKTLGASVTQIMWLLLGGFSKPIVIANLAVWPLIYVAMRSYFSLFAVRSALTPLPFLLSLFITLLIAWLAVSIQATRAARMNPATVLRHE